MNHKTKRKLERQDCIAHREMVYGEALDRLLAGTGNPEYVTYRWNKLKQIKGGNKRGGKN